jgi:hypothetical protein
VGEAVAEAEQSFAEYQQKGGRLTPVGDLRLAS